MPNKNLNQAQKQAATHQDGPLLIIAGAGTGKTTVLIERLDFLLKNNLALSEEILITTFTEKAAGEMEDRADKLLPYGYTDLWINTFHSFCERILREHALDIGLPADFKLLNQTEQWILIKKNLNKLDLDYYRPLGNPTKFIHEIIKHFSRLKDENISAQEYLDYAENLKLNEDKIVSEDYALETKRILELANAYHVYNKLLLDKSFLDFGDLIVYTIKLFKERPNILEYYRKKFKYIMVDEFQDTNWAQYELIKFLAAPKNNLIVVGDDDQAIYKFRGASISNIMQFKDDFPKSQEVILNNNYRSGQAILDYSYEFIKHNNPNRLEIKLGINKQLKAQTAESGLAEHLVFQTEAEEIGGVAEKIKEIYAEGQSNYSDFAILVRANSTADAYAAELTRQNIPNQFVSLRGLYYKTVILDSIAYLKLLDNYHEASAIFRVLNMEIFKVDHLSLMEILKFARRKVWSIYEALAHILAISKISPEAVVNINKLLSLIKKHSELAKNNSTSQIFLHFVYDSGLIKNLDRDKDKDLFSYLNQFYRKIKKIEESEPGLKLKDFLTAIDLELEAGETGALKAEFEDADTVKIMTVHAAKGLEFKTVFLPALVDKKFPSISRHDKIAIPDALVREKLPEGDVHIEEERRLFYVAMTRAKERLYFSSARDYGGAREKKPSKFIAETGLATVINNLEKEISNSEFLKDLAFLQTGIHAPLPQAIVLPNRFSFSQLAAYENCPLQYKFNFILKVPVAPKPVLQFGRTIHNTLKEFLNPLVSGSIAQTNLFGEEDKSAQEKSLTLSNLYSIYQKYWTPEGYADKKECDDYYKKGRELLKNFYETSSQKPWPKIAVLEKNFLFKLDQDILKGAIDRIDKLEDNTLEIIDYKTGNPKQQLTLEDKSQLILYKIAVEEIFGQKVSKLTFYYLENGTAVSFEVKEAQEEKLKLKIKNLITKIKEADFSPKPGMLCQHCDFNTICEFREN